MRLTKEDERALARALKQDRDRLVFLSRKGGWFWTERVGNRVIYTGPFKTDKLAMQSMRKAEQDAKGQPLENLVGKF